MEGCCENQKAKDEGRKINEVMEVDGKEYLLYKPIPMDICFIRGTYADEEILTEKGKIDYRKFKPVLFQFPTYEYLETGDVLGSCMKMN